MLRPTRDGRALVLQQLLYADEVRSLSDVPLPDGEVREPELKLAKQLIDQIASETFDPKQYRDEVRERIQADIEKKVQGQDITETAEAPAEPARIIDLMAALKASLGKGKAAAPAPAEAEEPAASRRGAQKSEKAAAAAEPKRARKR
jgi:DNA end-binding protein Ku